MSRNNHVLLSTLIGIVLAVFTGLYLYMIKDPDPERHLWLIELFAQQDASTTVPSGAIVFTGSSAVRGWNLPESFPALPVINRGLGGSEISDINHYIEEIVLQYDPAIVVLYAGENDVVGRKSATRVLDEDGSPSGLSTWMTVST